MALVIVGFSNDPLNYPSNFSAPLSDADDDSFSTGTTAPSGAVWGGPDIHRGIIFDFGAGATVTSFDLYGNYIQQLAVSVADTIGSWSTLSGVFTETGYSSRHFETSVNQVKRYMRLSHHITAPGLQYFTWITISEVEIFGVLGSTDPPEEPPPETEPPIEPVILFPVVRGTAWAEPD